MRAAIESGVTGMLTVGCDRPTSLAAIAVAGDHAEVWATVGLHPHDAVDGVDSIVDLLDQPRVAAVGEAGLDYYYDHSPRDVQRAAFAAQIQLAHERGLPLVIHTRDAWDDTFDVLVAEGVPERVIFHCFTGGPDEARRCLEFGAFLSFSGIVTFKYGHRCPGGGDASCRSTGSWSRPMPRTSPLSPTAASRTSRHGCPFVGAYVADLKGVAVDEFAGTIWANARSAFPAVGS